MSISLPKQLANVVHDAVKSGQYASKSEFFRDVLRFWEEHRLLSDVRKSEREFRAGRARKLSSLKDLR